MSFMRTSTMAVSRFGSPCNVATDWLVRQMASFMSAVSRQPDLQAILPLGWSLTRPEPPCHWKPHSSAGVTPTCKL